ncbi:8-amino-7-oxononanoate synthase [Sphingosinicella microcystinivorans]|uniref:8-amino-7-oxononanoate synthase n=2 Tax=Sphingosinicella microcystinivorans TaxID=335406 RepID=A0AAD1D8G6_SPHMI|nr:pyridoxal phosphate-dependent aminotransferase family protein [Sphingosinicella microcystinivorans]RKS86593.1 glycine C-acetyltransferase/8-amino-7-oxononanoate synthase [Sphingosinicella microcystinivorans]BBE35298.1 8-amino-7-oxononanoate synthase [Sphingosinicella microcystinivorans]
MLRPHVWETMMQQILSPSAAVINLDGREVLSFAGCSYLGLAAVPELLQAGAKALVDQGATAQLARHYHAQSPANIDAEAEARRFFGTSGAMYFGGGYLFAIIALAGIAADYDVAILDETAHFCIFDGARAAQKEICTFKHCDPDDLERAVSATVAKGKRFAVATDGMFPTFGRVAPLADYARIIAPYDAWLIVDESHSFGSVGESGRGAAELQGVAGPKTLIGGSLSKGYGAFGGIAVGTAEAIERLWQSPVARGSAAGMSAGAAMSAESFRYIRRNPRVLAQLKANTTHLRSLLRGLGLQFEDVDGPVVAFAHGSADQMRAAQQALLEEGIYILYSTYVGAGPEGVLRIAAFADHKPEHFERLAQALTRKLL